MSSTPSGPPASRGTGLPPVAYLRVYQSLAAFPDRERAQWRAYLQRGPAPTTQAGIAREHAAGLRAVLGVPPVAVPVDLPEAFIRRHGGTAYICPWRTRLRAWLALSEFRVGLPEEIVAAFVPTTVADAAEEALEKWLTEHPAELPAIRSSAWHVPLPWFVLFDPAERVLVTTPPRHCHYVTTLARARARAIEALSVVRRTLADGPLAVALEDGARWLEEFGADGLVELDYGGLVDLLSDEGLRADDSASIVARGLAALAEGDTGTAEAAYEAVTERWRALESLGNAN